MSNTTSHPKGLYLLFATEMAERFSYYGMRALFTLYMVAAFFTKDVSSQIYGSYTGLVYLTPLLGGYIADRYWGNRRSIIFGGLVMAVGQFLMFLSACFVQQSIFVDPTKGGVIDPDVNNTLAIILMFSGLTALIFGNGFFKPNISTMVGDLYGPTDRRKDAAFTIFYMGINVGALIAPLVCGGLGEGEWNNLAPFKWGFLIACCAMLLSVLAFVLLKNKYLVTPDGQQIGYAPSKDTIHHHHELNAAEKEPQVRNSRLRLVLCGVGFVVLFCLFAYIFVNEAKEFCKYFSDAVSSAILNEMSASRYNISQALHTIWRSRSSITDYISAATCAISIIMPIYIITDKSLTKAEISRIFVVYIIAVFVIFFWSAFEQAGTSLTYFAKEQTDRHIFGWEVPTSFFQAFNPLFVVLLAPVMTMLWEFLGKRGKEPASPIKQSMGLMLLALGYLFISFGVRDAGQGVKVSIFWIAGLYCIHTLGELSLSPIGLSMVNKLSPARFASLLMGVWFMSNATSNILAGRLATLYPETVNGHVEAKYFLGFTIDSMEDFFMIFVVMAGVASILLFCLCPLLKKMMKGVQ